MRYLLFHILVLVAIASFVFSLMWTKGIIKDKVLVQLGKYSVRTRNVIDLSMIISRFLLPLPFVDQLRFRVSILTITIGGILLCVGIYFIFAGISKIYLKLMFNQRIDLVTDGVYGVVRHPIYFGDLMWPIGLSITFGAICSLMLTPIWIAIYLYTIDIEEKWLVKEYGEKYLRYRKRVKKLIPFIY